MSNPKKSPYIRHYVPYDKAAADVIRQKIQRLYASEPDTLEVPHEGEVISPQSSKHQQFIYELNHSGKDLAQVQTEWHNYYIGLSDEEKQQVWQEFYASNQALQQKNDKASQAAPTHTEKLANLRNDMPQQKKAVVSQQQADEPEPEPPEPKRHVRKRTAYADKTKPQQYLHSLLFGFGFGSLTIFIFLFGFFNEAFIAPFVQPARASADTPLIVNENTVAPTSQAQVIVPKINVQIPVNFSSTSTVESEIENDLESGVVHYPTTALPGQNGNSAYFGHSSNNIFNKGKYKFAFVLLHELVPGDIFYITKDSKVYAYKVFSKTVVDPSEVGVLNPITGHPATATLITCDPPGTSLRRLIVVGDQISPAVSGNGAAAAVATTAAASTEQLAGNGQTLWGRFISHAYGKVIVAVVGVVSIVVIFRMISRRSANAKGQRW